MYDDQPANQIIKYYILKSTEISIKTIITARKCFLELDMKPKIFDTN